MTAPARGRSVVLAAALPIAAIAAALRVESFHAYADTWDPCEYVWAVQDGFLPHSPYILYLWLGRLAALAMPADVGLAVVSLVAGLAAVMILGVLVSRQTGSALAGCVAAAALAVFPCAVWFSGIQEVYALAAALGFGALLLARGSEAGPGGGPDPADSTRGAILSGLVFGCALAAHSGMVFAAPAWALAVGGTLAGATLRAPAWRRLGAALAAAAVAPAAAVAWVAWVLPRREAGGEGLVSYLAGIAPLAGGGSPSWTDSIGRTLAGALEQTLVAGAAAALLGACAVVALMKLPRTAAFWLVHAAPYLLYETFIGWNVDPGVHLVFAGPAVAALLGAGAAGVVRWSDGRGAPAGRIPAGRWAAPACIIVMILGLAPAALASHGEAATVVPRAAFLSSEPVRTLVALRDAVPGDAVVVQPPTLDNVNLIPAYGRRRPVIFQEGMYLLFEGSPGAPLNLSSFSRLTRARLEALLGAGTPVISLVADPFPVSALGLTWKQEGNLYRLQRAR